MTRAMRIAMIFLALAGLCRAGTQAPTAQDMEMTSVRLKLSEVDGAKLLRVKAMLCNLSQEDWAPETFRIAAEILSADGEIAAKIRPLLLRSPVAAGKKQVVTLNIKLPMGLSGKLFCRLKVYKGNELSYTSAYSRVNVPTPGSAMAANEEKKPAAEQPAEEPVSSPSQQSPGYTKVMKSFETSADHDAFSGARISPRKSLILDATKSFVAASAGIQAGFMSSAASSWRSAMEEGGLKPESPFITVVWPAGGQVWQMNNDEPVQLDQWSDSRLNYTRDSPARGKFFGFLGGQLVTGGPMHSSGINGRVGSTFFRGRCDASLSVSYSSVLPKGAASSQAITSIGLTGRMLFPLSAKMGWNAGLQLLHSSVSPGGTANTTLGALGGVNFYMPGNNSIDLTLQLGNHSTYGILAGYTFHL